MTPSVRGAISAFALSVAGVLLAGAQAPSAPAAQPARFVVVLDAAHGGGDTGGHLNDGQFEKAATLALSVRLRSLLAARGIDVVTTRETDQSLDPTERAGIANHARAQACLSLHAAETGSGVHLYASNLAADPGRAIHALEDGAIGLGYAQPWPDGSFELGVQARRRERDPGTDGAAGG